MNATSASTITTTTSVTMNSRLRRLAVRATVATFMLATSIVGLAGAALAGPEMGC